MCGCNIDFDVLNSCHFKNFINSLRPAYKIPSQDAINTLLSTLYHQLIQFLPDTEESDSEGILMLSTQKYSENSTHIIGILHKTKAKLLVKLWMSPSIETNSTILNEGIELAKTKFNTYIYAIIANDDSLISESIIAEDRWYLKCQATIAKDLTNMLFDSNFFLKVKNLLQAFSTVELIEELMKHGGKLFQLNDTDNSSCFACRDMCIMCV